MRTDVKVGLICAFAIVLCVLIYFVARGKQTAPPAHADMVTSGTVTPNSDLQVASPATPGHPVVTLDPLVPDHSIASSGNPVGGGLISPPGSASGVTPATPGATGTPTPASPLPTAPVSPFAPTTPDVSSGTPVVPVTPILPTPSPLLTPTVPTPTSPTLFLGAGNDTGARTYKIQKGDMLGVIAKKYNVTVKAIEEANPGIDANRLKVDTEIKIPAARVASASPATPTPAHATPARPGTVTSTSVTIKPGSTYTIKKGDTLAGIAKAAYGTTSGGQKIFRANRDRLNDPDVIPVGASIKIP